MKLHIIAAALPPLLDGIGDYTACLAAELAHSAEVTVLTGAASPAPIPGVRIETAFSADIPASVRGVTEFVERDRPDWVLLQYNPFSYGRWGLNLHLPETLRGLRRVSPKTRLAVMVHEPFVPTTTPQFAVMATWQRWQLWRLGTAADIVFFSIDPWAQRFGKWFPGKPVLHLSVGSNIPRVPITRQEARARLGIAEETIVLGLFGTMHVSRLLQPVRSAVEAVRQAGIPVQLLYVGPHFDAIRAVFGSDNVIANGPFPTEEVSRRLSAMDIYLAAYMDGVSTRRGAFTAALQHGLATVGTRGHSTDTLLEREHGQAFLLADVADLLAFTTAVCELCKYDSLRQCLEQGAQTLYENEFAWPRIVEKLLNALTHLNLT